MDQRLPRNNPFRVECQHQLPFRSSASSTAELAGRFQQLARRAAIVGPHGTGKTTLIEEICALWRERGTAFTLLRLSHGSNQDAVNQFRDWINAAQPAQILILDGAEQLSFLRWHWLRRESRKFAGLLITTHAPGRLPTLHQIPPTRQKRRPGSSFRHHRLRDPGKHRKNLPEETHKNGPVTLHATGPI